MQVSKLPLIIVKAEEKDTNSLQAKNTLDAYNVLLKALQDVQFFHITSEEEDKSWEYNSYAPLRRVFKAIYNWGKNNIQFSTEQKAEVLPLLLNALEPLIAQIARFEYQPKSYFRDLKLSAEFLVQIVKILDIEDTKVEVILADISKSMTWLDRHIQYHEDCADSDCEE